MHRPQNHFFSTIVLDPFEQELMNTTPYPLTLTFMQLLIIDHNPLQTKFFQKALKYENFGTDSCLPENLKQIWYYQYDAIIIPSPLSFQQLEDLILKIREIAPQVPLIIIGSNGHLRNPLFSPEKKTFFLSTNLSFSETATQIKHCISKNHTEKEPLVLKFEDLILDCQTREVKRGNLFFFLRNKEFVLLQLLMLNPNRVLTRNAILEYGWDRNTSIFSNTIDVHINSLRRKIDRGFIQKLIHTISCAGYYFGTKPILIK